MRKSGNDPVRLGIIGTGRIANRFMSEARCDSGVVATSVYHPHIGRAELFADKHQLQYAASSMEDLLANVDAVYIASPHATHYAYIHHALINGKHVLCEKPMVLEKKQAVELYALANDKNCVLMEGIKTAYCPGFVQLLDIARSGRIGAIRDVEASFTKLTDPALRELTDVATGGSFLELASYTLLAAVKLLGSDYQELRFDSFYADNGVDLYTKAYLKYQDSWATSKTGLGVKSEGQLLISGTQGYIRVDAPWWKTQSFEVCYEDVTSNEQYRAEFTGDGLRYEIREFVSAIYDVGQIERHLSAEESIALAGMMEMFLLEKLS